MHFLKPSRGAFSRPFIPSLGLALLVMIIPAFRASAQTAQTQEEQQTLAIEVFRGEGAIHDVRSPQTSDVVIRVADPKGTPLQGVAVVFQLPSSGPGGVFADGGRFATVLTNEEGIAEAKGLMSNKELGEFEITVTASFRDFKTESLRIKQSNSDSLAPPKPATAKKRGSSSRTIAIVAVAGGALAGIALGLAGGGSSSSGGPGPVTPPTTSATIITAGTPVFRGPN
jgi:hypothetical protein